jgi:hypothetical protein
VPEQQDEDDDWDGHSEQPEQDAATHGKSPSADIPWIYIADRRFWFLPGSSSAEPEFVEAHLLGIAAAHLFDTAGLLSALHL